MKVSYFGCKVMPEKIVVYSLVSWSCCGQINRQKNPMAVQWLLYHVHKVSRD
jgi:hypothetical protein